MRKTHTKFKTALGKNNATNFVRDVGGCVGSVPSDIIIITNNPDLSTKIALIFRMTLPRR